MSDLLFDAPWWLIVLFLGVGGLLAAAGLRRGDKTLRNVGAVIAVLGLAVAILSWQVETEPEKISRMSRELVASVEKKDWATMSGLMDPQATLSIVGGKALYNSREEIVKAGESRTNSSGVTSLNTTRVEATREGQLITAEVDVYVTASDSVTGGRPFITTWKFVWTRSGGTWVVREIEAIQLGNIKGSDVQTWFPRITK